MPTPSSRCRCTSSTTNAPVIDQCMSVIKDFAGKKPRGWFGPGLTQTYQTLDFLAEAGIEYIGDWVLDDQPVHLKTTVGKSVVALPYNYELHDIVMMAIQYHESQVFRDRALDYFETVYAEKPRIHQSDVNRHASLSVGLAAPDKIRARNLRTYFV